MSAGLRPGLPPLPSRMAALPLDARGYPVPFFVAWIDGAPDFRVADQGKMARCVREHLCWLCGKKLGSYLAFVAGPMCALNRTSSEPPSHRECAVFAAMVCPFLVRPKAQRRIAGLPEERDVAAGFGLKRNPGVTMVWITKRYRPFRAPTTAGGQGVLFEMGLAREVLCFAEGRVATPIEVRESVRTGLPALLDTAQQDGERAVKAFYAAVREGCRVLDLPNIEAAEFETLEAPV